MLFCRAPIDEGHKKEVVIDHNIVTADGLAIDWVYSHLYWTDTGTNSICLSDLDGNLITTIIKDDLEEPRAIALHPEKGYNRRLIRGHCMLINNVSLVGCFGRTGERAPRLRGLEWMAPTGPRSSPSP